MSKKDKLSSCEKECVKESHDVTVLVAEALIAFEKTETGRFEQLHAAVDRIEAFEKKYADTISDTISDKISILVDVSTRRWRSMLRGVVYDELETKLQGEDSVGRRTVDKKIKHAPVIEEAIYRATKEDELWGAYQKELLRLELRVSLLHRNTLGMYICKHDYQLIDFLIEQKKKLTEVREANDEFIRLMLRNQEEQVEEIFSKE